MGTPSDTRWESPEERVTLRMLQAASADEAFADGQNSAWGGMGQNDNPYPRGSLQHDRWILGYHKTLGDLQGG